MRAADLALAGAVVAGDRVCQAQARQLALLELVPLQQLLLLGIVQQHMPRDQLHVSRVQWPESRTCVAQ